MRILFRLIRNLLVLLFALLQAGFRLLRRGPLPEWVSYELSQPVERGERETRSWVLGAPDEHISTLSSLGRELSFLGRLPWVRGIVLRVEGAEMSGPVRHELRALLERFRKSGKGVVVHADQLDTRAWHLSSVATQLWLSPRGRLELTGISLNASAAAGLLAKFGVKVEVVRAGRFKSAGELVGLEQVSADQKEQLGTLLDDIYEPLVEEVASGRGRTPQEVKNSIDDGPYAAERALEAGLVDGLCYSDEIAKKLGKDDGREEDARVAPFYEVLSRIGAPLSLVPLVDTRKVVAILDVDGLIAEGKNRMIPGFGHTAGSKTLIEVLESIAQKDSVAALVLRIDSRGGSALASDLIWHAVRKLDAKKPVVAFLDSVAASGGYYIAAGARRIVASPACLTGSIGVFTLRPDLSGLFEKSSVDRVLLKRGRNAGLYELTAPLDEEAKAAIQRDVDFTWGHFASVVAEGRNMPLERAKELADGRVVLAPRAKELGLVDALGTLDDAISEAAKAASLETHRVVDLTPHEGRLRQLLSLVRGEQQAAMKRVITGDGLWAFWPGEMPR